MTGKETRKILIVEDEYLLAEMLKARLEFRGYDTCYADDGEEAVEMAKEENPDLILMDIILPKLDGVTAMERIRSEVSKKIPVIFLTALSKPKDRERVLDKGFPEYMTKPFSSTDLEERIRATLQFPHSLDGRGLGRG